MLRERLQLVELAARERLRHAQEAHGLSAREDAELRAARELGRVLELEPVAQVGLVGAEAAVGLGVGHAREGRVELDSQRLAPDRLHHPLHQLEDQLLVGKGHLDVELRDLLDAVGAEILVAEADRDLVVALEVGDHEQLLGDLRRLRQRVEAARLEPRRHEEVARALRRRLPQDRRLDVDEAGVLHHAPDRPDHLPAQADVPLELGRRRSSQR